MKYNIYIIDYYTYEVPKNPIYDYLPSYLLHSWDNEANQSK